MTPPPDLRREAILLLAEMGEKERWRALRRFSAAHRRDLLENWRGWAHENQRAPAGDDWRVWLIRAGRGFGKTRAGAEWVGAVARATPGARIALVGATADEVRRVMIEGDSGLLNTAGADDGCEWRRASGEVRYASGAVAFVFSADAPDGLRGPQHHAAWCDEVAKWRYGEAAWDNLLMGLTGGWRPAPGGSGTR